MTEIVDWLMTPHGQSAIDTAVRVRKTTADPLALAATLDRELGLPATYRAAASLQADLRQRLIDRWGEAPDWLLTRDGIEQATHPIVRRWRSARLAALGVKRIADVGCALGFESGSFAAAGMSVRAVERDVETAAVAVLNLKKYDARVDLFDVVADADALEVVLADVDAVFVDPARRDASAARSVDGRSGNRVTSPSEWSPSWDWVCALGERQPWLVAKAAPGIDHELLPAESQTTWFAIRGVLVEASVWWPGFGLTPGRQAIAVDRHGDMAQIDSTMPTSDAVGGVGAFVLDPAPSVTRSGLVTTLAAVVGAHRIDENIGYLSCDVEPEDSPLFTTFEVLSVVPLDEKKLKAELLRVGARDVQVTARGYRGDIDALTKSLKKGLAGDKVISVLIARIGDSMTSIVAQRLN